MKNRLIITMVTAATASMFLLSGCGSDTPEEVAKEYVSSLSSADIDDVKELVTDDVQKTLGRLKVICSQSDVNALYKETVTVLGDLEQKSKDSQYDKKLKEIHAALETKMEQLQKDIEKETLKKYGSPKDIPQEQREKLMNEALAQFMTLIEPAVEEILDTLEINTEHPSEVQKTVTQLMLKGNGDMKLTRSNSYLLEEIVQDVVSQREGGITPVCVAKYTEFGNIDDINVIETQENSPDQVGVRLELINEEGKSNKVTIDVEKIKDEWKVSELYLNTFF